MINYAIRGVSVCKPFFKYATGVQKQLFDKIVREQLHPLRVSSKQERKLNKLALATPLPPVKKGFECIPCIAQKNLAMAEPSNVEQAVITTVELIFKGITLNKF